MKKNIIIYQFITVIAFLVLILLPLFQDITNVFTLQKLEGENRAIAEKPKIDYRNLDTYPTQFSSFYNDNFPFRALFFKFDYRILFKKSPIEQVIIGRNKWLFSGTKEAQVYQKLNSFSEKEMSKIIQELIERKKKYDEMGIKFYIAVAPTTFEIYPEHLPRYFVRAVKTTTDRFCELLENTDIPFIYLKDELLKNKAVGQLYRSNDNHWNELGAYFAYRSIVDIMQKDFPQIPVYPLSDFELIPEPTHSGNLINMLSDNFQTLFDDDIKYEVLLKDSSKRWVEVEKAGYPCTEGFPYPWEFERDGEIPLKDLPNIVIFRDSYFNAVIPFFFNSFSRSVAIFDAWQYKENMDIVLQENPKLVLLVIYEPHISNLYYE